MYNKKANQAFNQMYTYFRWQVKSSFQWDVAWLCYDAIWLLFLTKIPKRLNINKKKEKLPCPQMANSLLLETTIITGQLQTSRPHLSWRLDYLCHQQAALSPDGAFTVQHNRGSRSQAHTLTFLNTHLAFSLFFYFFSFSLLSGAGNGAKCN